MNNKGKQTEIFFAIPCGEFYSVRYRYIKAICKEAGVKPIIIQDQAKTGALWEEIVENIDCADYFVADISSESPNVILELGYSTREKRRKYAVFKERRVKAPSDLGGLKFQEYATMREFKEKLVQWIVDNVPCVRSNILRNLDSLDASVPTFREDFFDWDRFIKLWHWPPGSYVNLTSEGLHFTNAHLPIMTTHFGLLRNYEFKFKAKIKKRNLGWIVKGTREHDSYFPGFCVMFNIDEEGRLQPHILNWTKKGPEYKQFKTGPPFDLHKKDDWFTLTTKVVEDKITVLNGQNIIVFHDDFTGDRYKEWYEFPNKQGEVGFRCHPGEEGIIRCLELRETEIGAKKTTGNTV